MQVAVWDTYARSDSGDILHFDIIVPETVKQEPVIFRYGSEYLAAIGESSAGLSAAECRFCHIETPSEEMMDMIGKQGYYILELERVPRSLPADLTRSSSIRYLRAHFPKYRFQSFAGIGEAELKELLHKLIR